MNGNISKTKPGYLQGYQFHESGFFVPDSVAQQLRAEGTPAEPPPQDKPLQSSTMNMPSPTHVRKRQPPRGMHRVFTTDSVKAFKDAISSHGRGGDRRKTMEAMLPFLETEPVGFRKAVRVSRDLEMRCEKLRTEMPNFRQVIDQIELLLQLQRAGDGVISLPPLLLGGDPGVGKTFFASRLATLMKLEKQTVNMETATASWVLSGSSLQWNSGAPGAAYNAVVRGGQANPIFILDEIDKAGGDQRYSPINALYALLEPGSAREFRDEACPEVALDVRGFNWVATANTVKNIPPPLLNRMVLFFVPMPSPSQKRDIARSVYRIMIEESGWGRRFSKELSEGSIKILATSDGSIRAMRGLIQLGLAHALKRGSAILEAQDLNSVLTHSKSYVDLEQAEPVGRS